MSSISQTPLPVSTGYVLRESLKKRKQEREKRYKVKSLDCQVRGTSPEIPFLPCSKLCHLGHFILALWAPISLFLILR